MFLCKWRNSAATVIGLATLVAGLGLHEPAQGKISRPSEESCEIPDEFSRSLASAVRKKKTQADFRKLRPVAREEIDFSLAGALESKATIEEIFDREFTRRMRERYQAEVKPHEQTTSSPFRRATKYEQERYWESRKDMANWTAKEVLSDQLKELFRNGDKDSAPMKVFHTMKEVMGNDEESEPSSKLSPEEKIARAHRLDLPKAEQEEVIPTKLKARMNVLRGRGQLNFMNPIVQTALNVNVSGDENFSVDMNKEVKELTLKTNASFGIDKKKLTFNLNKKIADRVYFDLNSERYTGSERGSSGERNNETAKITYSLSF